MKITQKFNKGGYSAEIASNYIDNKKPIYSLSNELYPQQRFENNDVGRHPRAMWALAKHSMAKHVMGTCRAQLPPRRVLCTGL